MSTLIKLSEQCSRCPREELTTVTLEQAVAMSKRHESPASSKALVIVVDGQTIASYDKLCEECRGICAALVAGVKPQAKKSARRFKRVAAEPSSSERRQAAARGG